MIRAIWTTLRPKQWTKNILVFAGLVFAQDAFNAEKILTAVQAFILFSLMSSSGYLINDVLDKDKDALHPHKRYRPVAAGELSSAAALVVAAVLFVTSIYFAWRLDVYFCLVLSIYFFLTFSYSLYLKKIIILDVMIIAAGFMLRAIGGTIAIHEPVSSWLIICTTFLTLFLALTKRRSEIVTLGTDAARVRTTLSLYNLSFLDQMINTMTAACLIAYALYTLDPETVAKFQTRNLVMTLPFVIFGLFRYLSLVHNNDLGESPELVIFRDKPILTCIGLYGLTVFAVIYF